MNADVHTLIGAYALDAVDDAERRLVDRHLDECASCAQEAAELREAASRLADVTIAEPPPRLRERVLAEARRTRQEAPPDRPVEPEGPIASAERILRPRRLPRLRRALAATALVVVIAFAGGAITWVVMQQYAESEVSESDRLAAVLEAADAEVSTEDAVGGGQVTVVASASLDQAVVVVSDLAAVGEDRAYQLWLVNDEGPVSAGVMDPGDSSATMLVDGIDETDVMGVTEEPAGGSDAPTLPMVAGVDMTA
ncbi:anti-sigma factor [Glycomyces arizonensis]|uniref:anti-sigma factor n=1 Tax=Glycomyces arizonensis TaxID=256035 RepID=UPI0004299CB2|nr:anti-sigma factor [Glycomyces arizonensis]